MEDGKDVRSRLIPAQIWLCSMLPSPCRFPELRPWLRSQPLFQTCALRWWWYETVRCVWYWRRIQISQKGGAAAELTKFGYLGEGEYEWLVVCERRELSPLKEVAEMAHRWYRVRSSQYYGQYFGSAGLSCRLKKAHRTSNWRATRVRHPPLLLVHRKWQLWGHQCVGGQARWHWRVPPWQDWMLLPSRHSTIVPWASLWGLGREVASCLQLLAQNDSRNLPYQ